jgi:hypothetical protein
MSTFIEELKELPPDMMVYVGMKEGSNWIAIETAATLIKKMKKLDSLTKEITEKELFTNTDRIKALWGSIFPRYEKRLPKLAEDVTKLQGLSVEIFAGGYHEKKAKIEEKQKELETAKGYYGYLKKEMGDRISNVVSLQEYLKDYVPIDKRKVIDSYIITAQPMGKAILLEGREFGNLGMYDEITPL